MGELRLEEPVEASHPFGHKNIALRGFLLYGTADVVCMALQTGIDSIMMKSLQYPFQNRRVSLFPQPNKPISEDATEEIKQYEGSLLGCRLQSIFESIVIWSILIYAFLIGLGVLIYFLFGMNAKQFYLGSSVPTWKILIYHVINFIFIIPVSALPIFKLFTALSGVIAEKRLSKRVIELVGSESNRRSSNLS